MRTQLRPDAPGVRGSTARLAAIVALGALVLTSTFTVARADSVAATYSGGSITDLTTCVEVPVVLTRTTAGTANGFSVTVQLNSKLVLCGTLSASFVHGTWTANGLWVPVADLGSGSYRVDFAGGDCTASSGTLFTVRVRAAGSGTSPGTVSVSAATMSNVSPCTGAAPTVTLGTDASIGMNVPGSTPAAVTNLAATQIKIGNGPGETTKIRIDYDARTDGATVEVYYKKFGNYPEYTDPPAGATIAQVDFKPATGTTPTGWIRDSGELFDPARHYGWDVNRTASTKVRNLIPGDPNDTFLRKKNQSTPATWLYSGLTPGSYQVKVTVGDALTSCRNLVRVQGVTYFENRYLTGGHFDDATHTVVVGASGQLQMEIGYAQLNVPVDSETKVTAITISQVGSGAPGTAPPAPASYPPSGWTLASAITAPGTETALPERDFYYFVAYAKLAGSTSTPAMTSGTLNYHLGDFADGFTECTGNNAVYDEDFSVLGANYGRVLALGDALACMDIAPTTDGTCDGRPVPDNVIDFKDLVIFACNYDRVSKSIAVPAPFASDLLRLATEETDGNWVSAAVGMQGAGRAKALSVRLDWNPGVVEPVRTRAGDLLTSQRGVALSPSRGTVDMALLGERSMGLSGEGTVASVDFRRIGAGDPGIRIAAVEARDLTGRPIEVAFEAPSQTELAAPRPTTILGNAPNPFNPATVISYSLGHTGPVEISIYSLAGRLVKVLARGDEIAGLHSVRWDGTDARGVSVASGLYLVRLRAADAVSSRSIVLVK